MGIQLNGITGDAIIPGDVGIGGTLTYEDVTNVDSVGIVTARLGVNLVGNDLNVGSNIKIGNASGIVTATAFHGDGSSLTGVGASFGNSSVNSSGIITATAFVPTTGQLSHRNLIYNGAMMISQRGTSSTSSGYHTLDRYNVNFGGTDEAMTVEQANVASGTTPYTLGFLKCLKVTNGNQTSGAGGGDWLEIYQYLEDQDICNSGWNFKSATSYLTLSFWVKSSVSQKFAGFFYTNNAGQGDSYTYSYQIDNGSGGNLSADTWTKITHTIPGSSSLTFNNDNTKGLAVGIFPFDGTDYTTSGHTEETWQQWSSSNKLKDMDSTWWTTNDATFELTGLQLEVGPVATPFEHRSIGNELARCHRYYQQYTNIMSHGFVPNNGSRSYSHAFTFPVEMRAAPTLTISNTGSSGGQYVTDGNTNRNVTTLNSGVTNTKNAEWYPYLSGDLTDFRGAYTMSLNSTSYQTTYKFNAEL